MTKEILFSLIKEYETYVKLSLNIFSFSFKIEGTPLIAHRNGKIPKEGFLIYESHQMKYLFHGIGCLCIYEKDVIVDFDFRFKTSDYKGFELGKMFRFIDSLHKNIIIFEELVTLADDLLKDNLLSRNDGNNIDTYEFYIS